MAINKILLELSSKLSPEKQALLKKLQGLEVRSNEDAIAMHPEQEPVPVSFAQKRLWFLDQLVKNSPAYNCVMALRINGNIKEEILSGSINEIIRRHESLRTTFKFINEQPYQLVTPQLILKLVTIDLSNYPESEREFRFSQHTLEEAKYVFNLEKGPLLRITLFRFTAKQSIILFNIHHIIFDGWSAGIFFKEFMIIYSAYLKGESSPLEELPMQYTDFSVWQKNWLKGEKLKSQLDYWKEKLGKNKTTFELPADRIHPPVQTFRGGNIRFKLSGALTSSIKDLSVNENATLFVFLLSALKILLYRYSGQSDVTVGSPIANRNKVEIENLIGFFVNTLVLRTDLSGGISFQNLLKRVNETAKEAYKHQDIPFELLVDELQPERNMSNNPLFQVCFVFQNVQKQWKSESEKSELQIEEFFEVRNGTSKFDLWVEMIENKGILEGDVEYNTDIFNESTIVRMIDSFKILLESIVSNPMMKISELNILSNEEKNKLLVQWNDTSVDYDKKNMCLHEIIQMQVGKSPDSIAVIFENNELTYRELNIRANQTAHYLRKSGVGPETIVGVFMERSLEMVIGLLGILKAGGAYLPLDPSYPKDRLIFMLEDSQVKVILTHKDLMKKLPENGLSIISMDKDWEMIRLEGQENMSGDSTCDNLAYVIYTSGSTGQPKGAMNIHKGITNRLLWMQETYQLTDKDRILQKTPFSFDVSVWEFFWALMTGACMVLAKPEGHKDTTYLARLIEEKQITTIHFVPSMLQAFLEDKEIDRCNSLKRVICSGEALPFSTQEMFFDRMNAGLYNLYGPTEAAVDVTSWTCRKSGGTNIVPIGRPIANTKIYILDEYLNPVPIGVPGELHIGGVQVARGYYRRPELTEEKFINDPFSDQPGNRMYKTGDLVRYMPDGNIEYLNRMDFQVKVRGFRIELPEIEAVLEQHKYVSKAIVLARDIEGHQNYKQLVAYLLPHASIKKEFVNGSGEALPDVQISEWMQVFNKTYIEGANQKSPEMNITGWNSSYTGLPLSSGEMGVWVDSTVDRILALNPKKVLEIGCGTGLLLSRIAPKCEQYWGTDFSDTALEYIKNELIGKNGDLSNVTLLRRNADNFEGLSEEHFDVIIINSVVQYFPDMQYLLNVLENAVKIIPCQGAIFIGDVRSLPLLEAFHTDVEMEKADVSLPISQLQLRVQHRLRLERELVIAPDFFKGLKKRMEKISSIDFQLKRGIIHNELAKFRYDVVLRVGLDVQYVNEYSCLDWEKDELDLDKVRKVLSEDRPVGLMVTNIGNARLGLLNQRLSLLTDARCPASVGELKKIPQKSSHIEDPENFWKLSEEFPYSMDISWVSGSSDGSYEVVFKNRSANADRICVFKRNESEEVSSLEEYTNHPLLERINQKLAPELKKFLKEKLPDYMIPSFFMVLKDLPVTSNGKLDRNALPAPLIELHEGDGNFIEPSTETEIALAEIWAEVLGLEKVGIENNFFELGGDSIHSIYLVSKARERNIQLTPQNIFQYQTIAELAEAIDAVTPDAGSTRMVKDTEFEYSKRDRDRIDKLMLMDNIEDVYPLSPFQEYMLYRYLNTPETGLYLVQFIVVLKISGFDLKIYEKAFQELVNQHPNLRTSIIWEDVDGPLQVVQKQVKAGFTYQDWRGLTIDRQEENLEEYLKQDRTLGVKPDEPVGMRLFIAQLDDAIIHIMSFSYLFVDGWTVNVLFRDLNDLAVSISQGKHPALPEHLSYKKYVSWFKGQDFSNDKKYWQETLKGFKEPNQLDDKKIMNLPGTEEGFARQLLNFSSETSSRLKSLSMEKQITMSNIMYAAWALMLSHYSGSEDVTFGVLVAGRPVSLSGIENMAGCTLNVLPLRLVIKKDVSLSVWLKEIMGKIVELNKYGTTSLLNIHKWVDFPENRLFFNSYMVFQNLQSGEDAKAMTYRFFVSKMGFPLRFDIYPQDNIAMHMSYHRNIYNDDSITLLMQNFHTVIKKICENPDQNLEYFFQELKNVQPSLENKPRIFYEGRFKINDLIDNISEE